MDLVTGATGFFGLNLTARLLASGRKVRVLLRDPAKARFLENLPGYDKLEVVKGDLRSLESLVAACTGVEMVYHAAAAVSSWNGNRNTIWGTNIKGVASVLSAARTAGVKRVVYISTVDAYGVYLDGTPANEDTPWNYKEQGLSNPYSDSKYRAHLIAERAAASQDVVIVCPGYMIGPRDIQLSSNRLVLAVAKGEVPLAPAGGNSFVHVDDVVDLTLAAAATGQRGRSYIAASENLLYREFFELVSKVLGSPKRFGTIPAWVASTAGLFGELGGIISRKEPNLHINTVRMANILHYYRSDRARSELNFNPRPVYDAVADSIAWFREEGIL